MFCFCIGLTCYSCNTDGTSGSGPECIDNPGKLTTVQCGKNEAGEVKDYCYTTRTEENDPETGDLSKLLIFSEIFIIGHSLNSHWFQNEI